MKTSECPCRGQTLDKLIHPSILAILIEGPLHGYKLVQRIAEMPMLAGRSPDASGVYRCLKGMEGRGAVRSSWDNSNAGPSRRSYEITRAGRECLADWISTLDAYRYNIDALLTLAQEAVARQQ